MEVIRYLEAVNDVEIIQESTEPRVETAERRSWIGAIKEPSQELLDYADKVRGEWDHRI